MITLRGMLSAIKPPGSKNTVAAIQNVKSGFLKERIIRKTNSNAKNIID